MRLFLQLAMDKLRTHQRSGKGLRPLSEAAITKAVLGERPGYVRGLGWGTRPLRSNAAESSTAAEERAAYVRELQVTKEMVQNQQTQIGQLQHGLSMLFSFLGTSGVAIPDFVTEKIGILPQFPPGGSQS